MNQCKTCQSKNEEEEKEELEKNKEEKGKKGERNLLSIHVYVLISGKWFIYVPFYE